MKTFSLSGLFCLVALLSGCVLNNLGVSGNGVVKEENRTVGDYTAIDNSSVFNVYIEQGAEYSLKVVADENILPLLHTHVENGTLYIDMENKSIRNTSHSDIFITLKSLEKMTNSGVGKVEIKKVTGTALKVHNSGVGSLKINSDYQKVDCKNNGVGNLEFTGTIKELKLVNSGVGSVDANEVNPDIAYVENSGVGSVKIRCEKELSIINRGVGSVRYSGNALIKDLVSEGVGSVKKGN